MIGFINLAGVAAAIVGSMALALGLEWISLRALMRLMPGRRRNMGFGVSMGDKGN